MENAMHVSDFNVQEFLAAHPNSYVIFVSGGWDYVSKKAWYRCLLCYGHYKKKIWRTFESLKSSNVAMLQGAIDACDLLKRRDTELFLITPTQLGFKKGIKGKGVNANYIQDILRICEAKNIKLHDIAVLGGGELLLDILEKDMFV